MLQSSYKLTRKNFQTEFELDNDLAFFNAHYPFPNDIQIYNKYKSFKTIFEFNGTELPQHYTKRLSLLNRIHYTIKLKQIKREEITVQTSPTHFIRYLLYYEPVPFSLAFARQNSNYVAIAPAKLEKILYETVKDLIQLNIYCQLTASYCGFTENGQFRIFIPPFVVLNERKLFTTDKQAIMSSADRIVKFWQMQTAKPREPVIIESNPRNSYRFNSPQPKKETIEHRNSEDDNIDVKKTIKLSKNYVKEGNEQGLKTGTKLHQLKKHRSMQTLQADIVPYQKQEKKGYQFLTKIEELNKKISNIRSVIKSKKENTQQNIIPEIQTISQRNSSHTNNNNFYQMRETPQFQQNCQGQVIFDKYQDCNPYPTIKNNKSQSKLNKRHQHHETFTNQSIDTYEQQMGKEYNEGTFEPNYKLRRTTQPILEKLKNTENKPSQSNWYYQSAGNRVLKRIIQKNKQICPQIFEAKDNGSISKKSAGRLLQIEPSLRSGNSNTQKGKDGSRLKKMVSLDNFESHAETKSINLSEFSNDLSNVKKRRERQLKNKEMKQKVQTILMKSKKAIELLKNPAKHSNK